MPDAIPPRDEPERVRAYILAQAEHYDPVDYWPRLLEQRTRLVRLFEDLTPEQAAWRPSGGEGEEAWSIVEVAQHLLRWTENIVDINHAFLEGRDVSKLPSGYLDPDPGASLSEVRRRLVRASHRLTETLLTVAGNCEPSLTVEHSRFGPLNARQWFVLARVHDTDHIRQVEALKQMDGFPSGK